MKTQNGQNGQVAQIAKHLTHLLSTVDVYEIMDCVDTDALLELHSEIQSGLTQIINLTRGGSNHE